MAIKIVTTAHVMSILRVSKNDPSSIGENQFWRDFLEFKKGKNVNFLFINILQCRLATFSSTLIKRL